MKFQKSIRWNYISTVCERLAKMLGLSRLSLDYVNNTRDDNKPDRDRQYEISFRY